MKKEIEIIGATLLSVEEIEQLPLELRKYNNWYWLRSSGTNSISGALVFKNGSILHRGNDTSNDNAAVRPVLKISNLNSSNLKIGDVFTFDGKSFQIISDNLAFCLTDIGVYCFREEWYGEDTSNYEKSDVKKFVDKWLENACH